MHEMTVNKMATRSTDEMITEVRRVYAAPFDYGLHDVSLDEGDQIQLRPCDEDGNVLDYTGVWLTSIVNTELIRVR